MTEFIGLAAFAEVPAVIVDVQRGGPSTGMPTRTQQSDLLCVRLRLRRRHQASAAVPRTRRSASSFTAEALDLADRLQTPVFVMTDLDIGMNHSPRQARKWDDSRAIYVGKVMMEAKSRLARNFGRYLDVDGDGIPFRMLSGHAPSRGAYFDGVARRRTHTRATPRKALFMSEQSKLLEKQSATDPLNHAVAGLATTGTQRNRLR